MHQSIQDASRQECSFDRVGWLSGVHHVLDPLQQFGKVRERDSRSLHPAGEWLGLLMHPTGNGQLATELGGHRTDGTGEHGPHGLQAVTVFDEEEHRVGVLDAFLEFLR